MTIEVYEIIIERGKNTTDRSIDDHIKSISKRKVGKLTTAIVPQKGEVLRINSIDYEVERVIRLVNGAEFGFQEDFYIEVQKYNTNRRYENKSNSWVESVPLCLDIEDEIK